MTVTEPLGPCREYRGPANDRGYAHPVIGGKQVQLTNWIVEQVEGRPLEPGELVMHRCDNPPCFLYDHLVRGTQSANIRDAVTKGRHRSTPKPGESNGRAVLTETIVQSIRVRYRRGKPGVDPGNSRELAVEFGVHVNTIRAIVRREIWSHVG